MIESLIAISKVIGAIGVIAGAVLVVHKRAWRPVVDQYRKISSAVELVNEQLRPNSGSSIHDAIGRIESRVTRGEAMNLTMLEASGRASWYSDAEGHCVLATRALCALVGFTPEEMAGEGWRNIIHPEDRDRVYDEWDHAVGQRRDFALRYRYQRRDGSSVAVYVKAIMIRGKGDAFLGHIGDATPIKEAA